MQALTIDAPLTKEEVKELESEVILETEAQRKNLNTLEFTTGMLTILFLVIACLAFNSDGKHELLGSFSAAATMFSAAISLYTELNLKYLPSVQELVFCKGKYRFIDIAIAEQDLPLAHFIRQINIQERELTFYENKFLCDYVSEIKSRKQEAERNEKLNKLLSKTDVSNE